MGYGGGDRAGGSRCVGLGTYTSLSPSPSRSRTNVEIYLELVIN
jgi:hypothetical protein